MSNFSIYVSHSIRGIKGKDATHEDMVANNKKAIVFGEELRQVFPDIDFYVPADNDEFVIVAYEKGYLDEQEILAVDCAIIDVRDMVLAWIPDQYVSNGMQTEAIHAVTAGKPLATVRDIHDAQLVIDAVLERRMR